MDAANKGITQMKNGGGKEKTKGLHEADLKKIV
jgi:hypothetical protein